MVNGNIEESDVPTDPQEAHASPGGLESYLNAVGADPASYAAPKDLKPNPDTSVEVKDSRGGGDGDSKNTFSELTAIYARKGQTLFGFEREGNIPIEQHEQVESIRTLNAITIWIMDAPCANRAGRWAEWEKVAKKALQMISMRVVPAGDGEEDEEFAAPPVDADEAFRPTSNEEVTPAVARLRVQTLLDRWSKADATILNCRIAEDTYGRDYAKQFWGTYEQAEDDLKEILQLSAKLTPAALQLFNARVEQYRILRESHYDTAMGYPTHDLTDLKAKLAAGKNIDHLVQELPWSAQEAYQLVTSTHLAGTAHSELVTALQASTKIVSPPPMPYPMMGGENGQGDAYVDLRGSNGNRHPNQRNGRR